MSNEIFCKFCLITCNGKAPYEQHLQSAKHLKKVKLTESLTSSEQPISSNIKSSSPTTTTINDNLSEDSLISSASFSISPETMRILLEWNHPRGYKPYCDICQLLLHGENNADIHFNSNNNIHNQKFTAWKRINENDAKYSCKVCSEIFSNENTMAEHFNSDSHENMIQQRSNLHKFKQIYQTYDKLKQARIERKDLQTSSIVDDNLTNQFEKLNVIDGTEQKKTSLKPGLFSKDKLSAVMKIRFDEDD